MTCNLFIKRLRAYAKNVMLCEIKNKNDISYYPKNNIMGDNYSW